MRVLGILWNGMQEHLEEALNDISKYGDIKDAFTINLGESYESFVRDIYAQDTIAEWKVNKKLETMFQCSDSRKITIVIVDVDTPKKEYHPLKKRMVYTNLENMKVNIRKKYSEIVKHYFFDNTLHATDDEGEFKADFGVVMSYVEKGFQPEPVELKSALEKGKVFEKGRLNNGTQKPNKE